MSKWYRVYLPKCLREKLNLRNAIIVYVILIFFGL